MKKYMILHVGFEKPDDEVMKAWQAWFGEIADRQVEQAGFAAGREVTVHGVAELARDASCLTGFNVIEASDLDEAEAIAAKCPFITAVRVYELR